MQGQDFEIASDKETVGHNDESVSGGDEISNPKITNDELLRKVVHNKEEAYELYRHYGFFRGFSVRKGKQSYYVGTKNIKTEDNYCSKEGLKYDNGPNEINFNKPDTITGCKAMVRFNVDEQGLWNVNRLVDEHNHEFASPTKRHLLRSVRSVSLSKGAVLNSMVNAGIRTTNVYAYMVEEGGGAKNLGFIKKDCYNYIHTHEQFWLIKSSISIRNVVCVSQTHY